MQLNKKVELCTVYWLDDGLQYWIMIKNLQLDIFIKEGTHETADDSKSIVLYLMLLRGKTHVYNKILPKVSFCDKSLNE